MNKLNYFLYTMWEAFFNRNQNKIKSIVDKVVSRPKSSGETVRADMQFVASNPYNLALCNITSLYGGRVTKDNWYDSANRVLRAPRNSSAHYTSCDDADDMGTVQRYDDDKLELTCLEHWYNIMFFRQSRFGQVRSPARVELREIEEQKLAEDDDGGPPTSHDYDIGLSIDGEIHKINGGKYLDVQLDPELPKIRIARRNLPLKNYNRIMLDLHHLSPPFV